jgi:hypothetical protein
MINGEGKGKKDIPPNGSLRGTKTTDRRELINTNKIDTTLIISML